MGLIRFTLQGFVMIKQDDAYSTWYMENIQLLVNIDEIISFLKPNHKAPSVLIQYHF